MENKSIKKIETGIKGLDQVLGGGLPENKSILINGKPGTGKSFLLNEFLYRGAKKYNQNGVLVAFEEMPEDIISNIDNLKWEYGELIKDGRIKILSMNPFLSHSHELSNDYSLEPILLRITNAIEKVNAKRVSIDSIGNLFLNFSSEAAVRSLLFKLIFELKKTGVTTLISGEKATAGDSKIGIEEYVSEGVIDIDYKFTKNHIDRFLTVTKLRGSEIESGRVEFSISNEGMEVYPLIIDTGEYMYTKFETRKKFGLEGLDKILKGGIPQGHAVLIGGNTGTGKTTLALQFLLEGLKNDENCLWIALEEPVEQLEKTAESHDWDIKKYMEQKKLLFLEPPLININQNKLLSSIFDIVEERDVERVVFDSVSSMESHTMNKGKVREFLINLSRYFKSKGVTSILNYLTSENFSATSHLIGSMTTNEMRISSIVDGIIILRFVERKQKVKKLINVLKLRGSDHKKDIIQYELAQDGFKLLKKFEK